MLVLSILTFSTAADLQALPDPGQKTVKACLCKSECGFTVDGGVWDWCYTQNNCGTYSPTRLAYWDYCVYPENRTYEAQSASVKQQMIWERVTKNTTGGKWPNLAALLTSLSVKTSMEDIADVMPAERIKYIHSVGSVGQVVWKPVAGNPYTGIFATGSQSAFIRFSLAKPIEKDNVVPGFGIKFLRNGVHSANFFAMPSLDGQSDYNFFALNFTNHPPKPSGVLLAIVAKKFSEASNCPLNVGLSDVASFDETGAKAATPNFPYKIVFVPSGKVVFPSTPHYDDAGLGKLFAAIPTGTLLFNVLAYADPAAEKAKTPVFIGTVTSKSQFVKSTYGDNHLFFKHQYMENDFKLRPAWLSAIDKPNSCGTDHVTTEPPNPMPHLAEL
jgi:hypothetical protein